MAGGVTVKQDNTEQVVDGIDLAIGVALEKIGLLAENYAVKKCPVDTGNLQGSITHEVDAGDNAVHECRIRAVRRARHFAPEGAAVPEARGFRARRTIPTSAEKGTRRQQLTWYYLC